MQVTKAVAGFLRKFQTSVGEHDTISWTIPLPQLISHLEELTFGLVIVTPCDSP